MGMTIAEQYEWAKDNATQIDELNAAPLDLTGLPIQVDVPNIDQLPNEQYALLRKNGLGCSDSSILTGVNPYKRLKDLIEEKSRNYLTEEELVVGDKVAVRKGRELEPFVIQKHSQYTGHKIIKPTDMYRHKEFPFLTVNFDGVMECYSRETGELIYIPDEIKIVTKTGARHYNRGKAYFRERVGYQAINSDELIGITNANATILDKAGRVGLPPYYYTQLQMEMYHLNAPFGFLTALFENEWELCTWIVMKDTHTQNAVIIAAHKAWEKIAAVKGLEFDENGLIKNKPEIAEIPENIEA